MTVRKVKTNPNMDDMPRNFNCTIIGANEEGYMKVPFSQGSAHTENPTLEDVLDCLALDASGVENAKDFEDWCGEYGYDIDSRKAEKIYNVCKQQAEQLKTLLGTDAYEQLLWHTERR
jgi:hypothetical protein